MIANYVNSFDTFANERVTVGGNICNNASYMQ